MFANNHSSITTKSEVSPSSAANVESMKKLVELHKLRRGSAFSLFVGEQYSSISQTHPGLSLIHI